MRQSIKEAIMGFIFSFRQSLKFLSKEHMNFLGGNLDMFYIFAPIYFFQNIKNKNKIFNLLKVAAILFGYGLIQLIFIPHLNLVKMIINILKILVCYLVYLYTKENIHKISLLNIAYYASVILTILTGLSLIFRQSDLFWRFNDGINLFSLTRLQLFYLEPSELGFHLIPLVLIFLTKFLLTKNNKQRIISIIFIILNLIPLYLAKPMGAIGIGGLSILIAIFYDYYLHPNKNKRNIYIFAFILSIVFIFILYQLDSPLIQRVIYTLQGNDGSNNYRIGVSFNVLKESLVDYHFLGCGFGNLHTEAFVSQYTDLGLTTVIVNSFIYFIIETGVLGIAFVTYLIYSLYKNAIRYKSVLKMGLTTFLVVYSFFGGHFTSGLAWTLYGILLSNLNDENFIDNSRSLLWKK